jgi:hypothetical protein
MPNQPKDLAEFQYEGGTFLIEIDTPPSSSISRASRTDTDQLITKAKQSFEQAIDRITPVAATALDRLRNGLTQPADEIEVKFGIKLNIETGAIITSLGGEANFEVVLKWKKD